MLPFCGARHSPSGPHLQEDIVPSSAYSLPFCHGAFHTLEERVGAGHLHPLNGLVLEGSPNSELVFQVLNFVPQLPGCDPKNTAFSPLAYRSRIEAKSPSLSLYVNEPELALHCFNGVPFLEKSRQLRMAPISFGVSLEYLQRKQAFSPDRNKPFGVQVLRMQRPQPHCPPFSLMPLQRGRCITLLKE